MSCLVSLSHGIHIYATTGCLFSTVEIISAAALLNSGLHPDVFPWQQEDETKCGKTQS